MKIIAIAISAIMLVGCSKSDETISIGSKENREKGLAVIAERQRQLAESDTLLDADIKPPKAASAPPAK
jgi:PBP1b-binding outer membrane lipoprotein LpoB